MGAPKKYEREELIDRAIEIFRRQGFNGTSTTELTDALGVNRKSMYAEFESKQGLFEAALERYNAKNLSRVLAPIENEEADLDSIRAAFDGYASASEGRFSGLGCLMCNTASERGPLDPASGKYVAAYLERLTAAFRNALSNSQKSGVVSAQADLDESAAFLTTMLIGVAACVRAKATPDQLWASSRGVGHYLASLQSSHSMEL